jgi:hypothetical protein
MTTTKIDPSSTSDNLRQQDGSGIAPLFTWHGLNVYPFFGAEGEGDGTAEPDSEPDDDDDDESGSGSAGDEANTVSREDFDKLRKQLSAADKAREDAQKRLKEIDDANKDELTKATERVTELEKEREAYRKDIADLRLQNAFLTAETDITWHDPGDALALAERKGYLDGVVGEDGTVNNKALTAKLKELAKASPHLVKTSDGTGSSGKTKEDPKTPTGSKVGSKGGNGGSKDEKVLDRYSKYLR